MLLRKRKGEIVAINTRKIMTILALLAVFAIIPTAISCSSSTPPSHQEVEEAVRDYMEELKTPEFWGVVGVEIIQIGESYKLSDGVNEIEVWPVKVNLLKRDSTDERIFDIAKNPFNEWAVLW